MRLKVQVRHQNGSETVLYFEVYPNSDTVGDVKHMVASRIGSDPSAIRLMFQGRRMEDGYTLANYRVQRYPNIPVFALPQPTGGGNPRFRRGGTGGAAARLHGGKRTAGV